jgi:hypothetical protein
LLSLPVLAGKLNKLKIILPALNSAICWKLFYLFDETQSAGNLLDLNLIEILRDYTPKLICCKYKPQCTKGKGSVPKVHIKLSEIRYKVPDLLLTQVKTNTFVNLNFSSYLTGLIEGDGTIIVPKTERSIKGKINYPSVQIVFHLKDLPLALMIQKNFKNGSLSKKKGLNAYVLTINNFNELLSITTLLNGNMRTPKIHAL